MKPRLIVEQKITPIANQYKIYRSKDDGSKEKLIAFAQQKRFAFKEEVTFYTDESKTTVAFSMRAEKVMDIHGKFFVQDTSGNKLGAFRKAFQRSIFRSTWELLDTSDNVKLTVAETNLTLALLRRFAGLIPLIGDIIDMITAFLKYHFNFVDNNNNVVGSYVKTTRFRDHYVLSISDEYYDSLDWRTLAAFSVALDALQSR